MWQKVDQMELHLMAPVPYLRKIWFSSFWARSFQPIRLQHSSNGHYWWTIWYFFVKFCVNVEVHKGEKESDPDFWGKFPCCPNWAEMAQTSTFFIYFKFLWLVVAFIGIGSLVFLFFCMKLGVQKTSKVTGTDFSGKISFGPNWVKRAQHGPIIAFFKNISKSDH